MNYFQVLCNWRFLFYFFRGHTTIRRIIFETSKAIWENLQTEYMPNPTKEQWLKVDDRYWELWNLPTCVGAIDRKHIKIIKAPPNSGSSFYNYKGYFSIVLMAVLDADGLFLSVDMGEYGRNSDGRALKKSEFGNALYNDQLNLSEPTCLAGEEDIFPYYLVADEAFPLTDHIMRPYAYPHRQLTNERII